MCQSAPTSVGQHQGGHKGATGLPYPQSSPVSEIVIVVTFSLLESIMMDQRERERVRETFEAVHFLLTDGVHKHALFKLQEV